MSAPGKEPGGPARTVHCADALQWPDAVCTPTPSAQMELDFACRMDGERCILVEH